MKSGRNGIARLLISLLGTCALPVGGVENVIYFLVEPLPFAFIEPPRDSCVLPIPKSQVADIQHARDLIKYYRAPDSQIFQRIIVAYIGEGADGINHDLRTLGLPAWNWHVKTFSGFWDSTLGETADSPAIVEQNPTYWAQKRIAFSSYGVVRELGEEPVFVQAALFENGVNLNWWSPGTNLVFTVESTASLAVPDWKPVLGTSWPISERTWTSSGEGTGPYFRVLRANGPGN